MSVCGFDMFFTFVWPGWEGSAYDIRIFLEILRDIELNFPKPPNDMLFLLVIHLIILYFYFE